MTEEKTTTKKTAAAKKSATATAAAAPAVPAAPAAPAEVAAPAKAPTAKKAVAATAPEKKAPAKKVVPTPALEADPPPAPTECAALPGVSGKPSPEERYRMVQSAAYFIAEKDGFQGRDTDYWVRAEREIALQLGEAAA